MSSFPLTNSYFSRWLKPPISYLMPLNPMIFQVSMASIPEITIVKTTNQSWFQHQPICFDQKIPDFEAKLGPSRGSCRLGLLAMPVSAGGTYQVRLLRTARGPVPPQPRWPGGSGDFMGIVGIWPTIAGWWFGTWILTSPIFGMMIQSEGVETTN